MTKEEALKIHPVALAFVGDAVYSLYVREKLVKESNESPAVYQRAAGAAVSAKGQNTLLERVQGLFTEEEADIFRRARNAKKASKAKNASQAEYNRSTGIEAVIGYLYLVGDVKRVKEILENISVSVSDGRTQNKEFKP